MSSTTKVVMHPKYGRGARKQVAASAGPQLMPIAKDGSYNIWYGKNMGGERFVDRSPAKTRCLPAVDSGWTRADQSTGEPPPICLFFARGCCTAGHECTFFHRIPNMDDEKRLSLVKDIFGRDRHATDRDDMGGIGTFNRENTTLYVGGLIRAGNAQPSSQPAQKMPLKRKGPPSAQANRMAHRRALESDAGWQSIEASAHKHWGEWGQIKYIKMLPEKACMFVSYVMRSSAEFAKEAMTNQSMDNDEILNCRWAHDDPNPRAAAEKEFTNMQRVYRAVVEKHGITDDQVIPELEDGSRPTKRQQLDQEDAAVQTQSSAPVYASQDPVYLNTRFASSMYAPLGIGGATSVTSNNELVYPETQHQYMSGTGDDADRIAREQQTEQWVQHCHYMLASGQADVATVKSWYEYAGLEWDGGGQGIDLPTIVDEQKEERESALAALAAYGGDDDDDEGEENEKEKGKKDQDTTPATTATTTTTASGTNPSDTSTSTASSPAPT